MQCIATWLTTAPPDGIRSISVRATSRDWLNTYSARGFGLPLTKSAAESRESTVSTGRIGPKISSAMTASVGDGSTITVGSMRSAALSNPPPVTTVPSVALISETRRSNWR